MCDFFGHPQEAGATVGHSVPDMDDLLDQLEIESELHPVTNPSSKNVSVESLSTNATTSLVANDPKSKEDELIEAALLDERVMELDRLVSLEDMDVMREESTDAQLSIMNESSGPIDLQDEQILAPDAFSPSLSPNNSLLLANRENDASDADIFAQIDQMDTQIRAEEAELLESIAIENEPSKQDTNLNSDNLYYIHSPSINHSLEHFVEDMVENVLSQVLSHQLPTVEKNEEETEKTTGNNEEALEISVKDEVSEVNKQIKKEDEVIKEEQENDDDPLPSTSTMSSDQQQLPPPSSSNPQRSPLATIHDLSTTLDEFKLTESELMLGKKKPYWIPDEDCENCMLCSNRFSLVNRRHHCRACGRVLCRACCFQRRQLIYMEEKEGKQRVCSPCNRTLDRIEEYEKRISVPINDGSGAADDRFIHHQSEQTNDSSSSNAVLLSRHQSVDESSDAVSSKTTSSSVRPKKSLLKQPMGAGKHLPMGAGRHLPPSADGVGTSTPMSDGLTMEDPIMEDSTRPEQYNQMPTVPGKRSVTFRDGVNPGQDSRPNSTNYCKSTPTPSMVSSPFQCFMSGGFSASDGSSSSTIASNELGNGNSIKKLSRKLSRRSRERRIEEEAQSLLVAQLPDRVWTLEQMHDGIGDELVQRDLTELIRHNLLKSSDECKSFTIALRRNFHLRIERKQIRDELSVLSICTMGLAAIGVDELLFVLQCDPDNFSIEDLKNNMLALLELFNHLFQHCLDPLEDSSLDYQMGIRKCVSRMARLYSLPSKEKTLFGHKAAFVLLHRPHSHSFGDLHTPNMPFLIAVLIHQEELPWAMCVPCRILLRLGMLSGEYPFPVINMRREQPVFTADAVQSSVLKVLNDFRHWSYRMARLQSTAVAIHGDSTDVMLPIWLLDEVRVLVDSNRNMVGWALSELSPSEADMEIDSHLVCHQDGENFSTRIFTRQTGKDAPLKATGVSFVIFDGALKGGEQLLVNLVEDGLVIRLQADLMEELVKALLAGESFAATNEQGHRLSVYFQSNIGAAKDVGALLSPIDNASLDGQFQYGLMLQRQLRSLNFFPFSSEWALRLSAVINMLPGKFPSALQPRFFEVCEQLTTHIVPTLEPFLQSLIAVNQRTIALRIHVEEETISYDTEKWPLLPDQHFIWTTTLDEKIIPFLYTLCAWLPGGFFVELHNFIVSARPLPALTVSTNN